MRHFSILVFLLACCAVHSASASVSTTEPKTLSVVITFTNPSYANELSGSIALSINNGMPPYAVIWSNGNDGEAIEHLTKGEYNYFITDARGCTASGRVALAENSNFITDKEAIAFNIFPNPNNGTFVLLFNSENNDVATLDVTDATGRVVLKKNVVLNAGPNNFEIELTEFAAGIYDVSITHNDHVITQRVNVQNK